MLQPNDIIASLSERRRDWFIKLLLHIKHSRTIPNVLHLILNTLPIFALPSFCQDLFRPSAALSASTFHPSSVCAESAIIPIAERTLSLTMYTTFPWRKNTFFVHTSHPNRTTKLVASFFCARQYFNSFSVCSRSNTCKVLRLMCRRCCR